jgi:hypothetical protein
MLQWPEPLTGARLELPIMGEVLTFTIPHIDIPSHVTLESQDSICDMLNDLDKSFPGHF